MGPLACAIRVSVVVVLALVLALVVVFFVVWWDGVGGGPHARRSGGMPGVPAQLLFNPCASGRVVLGVVGWWR